MLASTVSSKMLKKMANVEGFYYEETLTGFKWLGNKAIDLGQQEYEVLFAYEEAIGFMIGHIVKDKDGISALATFAELVVQLDKRGLMISEYLEELHNKYVQVIFIIILEIFLMMEFFSFYLGMDSSLVTILILFVIHHQLSIKSLIKFDMVKAR